jgi:hypothetical protein
MGMRFEDVDPVVLEIERIADSAPLGPPPARSGPYGCSALMAAESRFAEPESAARVPA